MTTDTPIAELGIAAVRRRFAELEAKREEVGVDGLSLVELLDLDALRKRLRDRERVERLADLAILLRFDTLRQRRGHDYGCGQRAHELGRRRGELERLDVADRYPELDAFALTPSVLAAAWQRVGAPRARRLLREDYRAHTAASSATRRAWLDLISELTAIGVEVKS